jgi:3',5'-cyclic AMP phosphodiesterase CpdA
MRLAWLTDLHLNFTTPPQRQALYQSIRDASPDALLVGGDWAEAPSLVPMLNEWQANLALPTYFVLGNHDFYYGSFHLVQTALTQFLPNHPQLHYLSSSAPISLTPQSALIGHDSWADGRCGNFFHSHVQLNDYLLIQDLKRLHPYNLYQKLNQLGDQAADYLASQLTLALTTHQNILLLTHVPPFREACWHEGQISDDNWLPHFANQAVGQRLATIMAEHPKQQLTILCGHTHSAGTAQILPNLIVHTGAAIYGEPAIQQIVTI